MLETDSEIVERIMNDIIRSSRNVSQTNQGREPIIQKLNKNIIKGLKIAATGIKDSVGISWAITSAALYVLGYQTPKKLYENISSGLKSADFPGQIKTVIELIDLSIKGNADSIEKLKEYTKLGVTGIVAGPPLIAIGLACGALFALGKITKNTLSSINAGIKNKIQDESISSNKLLIELDEKLFGEDTELIEELIETNKNRHIIDKILDEPITYDEERPDIPLIVARIEEIEEKGDNINHNFIKNIFMNREQNQNIENNPNRDEMI
jgi:hypothetical protein